jgi:hypothetical protein
MAETRLLDIQPYHCLDVIEKRSLAFGYQSLLADLDFNVDEAGLRPEPSADDLILAFALILRSAMRLATSFGKVFFLSLRITTHLPIDYSRNHPNQAITSSLRVTLDLKRRFNQVSLHRTTMLRCNEKSHSFSIHIVV